MATNRPAIPVPGLYYRSSVAGTTDGLRGYLTTALSGISVTSKRTITVVYSITTAKDDAVTASNLLAYIQCIANGVGRTETYINNVTGNGGENLLLLITDPGFDITSIVINISASREFNGITNGIQSHTYSVTIPIREHQGGPLTFLSSGNNYLQLPVCNASNAGSLYFIKNTSNTTVMMAPHLSQLSTTIESASYTFNGYPQLRLQAYQCVGLLSNGAQWFIMSFYTGAGTGQGRDGDAIAIDNITSNIIYGNINSNHLRVTLPAPSSRQMLMIVAERTQNMYGYQLQLNQPASGTLIDGRWSELNLNITSNRNGNCAVFLISNGSTWYIASMFDMTDMDNFGTTTLTTTAPVTSAIGINTSGAVTSNVWSGRSYDTMAVTPFPLNDGTAVFRIFKENNSAVSNGFGLKASNSSALFTNSYSGPDYSNSNTQMFIYGSNTLMAMFGLEIKRPGVANRIYFLGQYPTRF